MAYNFIIGELRETTKGRFEWQIDEFSPLIPTVDTYYSPYIFFMDRPLSLSFCQPKNYDYLAVYLHYESEYMWNANVTISFSIKKNDGTLYGTKFAVVTRDIYPYIPQFLHKSVLQFRKSELLPQDTLTIVCDMKNELDEKETLLSAAESNSMKAKEVTEVSENMELTEFELLSKNLKDLLSNKDSCDAVLLVQGKEFNVHKSILIARSTVFAAMFQHNTSEKETGKVVIPDCDPTSFQMFLEYLYCGRLEDLSSDSALHLYYTSDKYNLQELKSFCIKYLMCNLTLQNICDVVSLADKYDEMSLLSATQDFFNKNLKEILITSEWENLFKENFRLANKLLIAMSKAKKTILSLF